MPEKAHQIATGKIVHGRGNELTVRDLLSLNGVEPDERTVIKEPNRCFFGWQTPRYEDMKEYLDALEEFGFRVRESLKLIELDEDVEITRVRDCTRKELRKNLWDQLTIGAIMKIATAQLGKRGGKHDFVLTEEYSQEPCMTMSDAGDETWGPQLCELLEQGEEMHNKTGLMVDPLGGAAIIGALKYLVNPKNEPVLSNLEKGPDGKIIVTDVGLMKVRNGERVSNIPCTRWLMALSLRLLGDLSFEAMNIALRDYGHDLKPRELGVANAAPKAVAWLGYQCVKAAKRFWEWRGTMASESGAGES